MKQSLINVLSKHGIKHEDAEGLQYIRVYGVIDSDVILELSSLVPIRMYGALDMKGEPYIRIEY